MELLNTLIVDHIDLHPDFTSLIQDNNFIVFVVMGDDVTTRELVERADILADDHSGRIVRKVAWIKERDLLRDDCLAYLLSFPDYDEATYDQTMAYVLSPRWHETKYVFWDGDPITDFDVSKAYWKASLREREEEEA